MATSGFSLAQECHESGPEPHAMAPIGIMGGHTHSKGHFMASYRYMLMDMKGLSLQGAAVSSEDALQTNMMAPTDMRMQMHMVGLMYAPLNGVTIGLMTSYKANAMNMESMANHTTEMTHNHSGTVEEPMELSTSSMSNQGLGDTRVMSLLRFTKSSEHCLHGMVGAQLPTGGVDAGDAMHKILPYAMQNGTGSVSALLGLNYSWLTPNYLFGAQALSNVPLHKNKRGYMSSVSHDASLWAARKIATWLSASIRVHGHYQTGVRGADALIDGMMSPAGNGLNEELIYTDAQLGLNIRPFNQWRIAVEAGLPFYQYNEGVHLNQNWMTTLGLQFMLH